MPGITERERISQEGSRPIVQKGEYGLRTQALFRVLSESVARTQGQRPPPPQAVATMTCSITRPRMEYQGLCMKH